MGPTIFLRLSYVIGEVGLLLCLLQIALIFVIACMMVQGVSAIVTNGRMRPGGPYFLISRTLGPELGGAIGLVLLVEHVVASVYFLAVFGEIIALSSSDVTGPIDYSYNYSSGIIFSTVCLIICLCMALLGNRRFSTVSVLLYWTKITPLLVAIGSFLFRTPGGQGSASDDPVWNNTANGTIVWEHFTGPNLTSLQSNLYQHEEQGEVLSGTPFTNFLSIFGVVFAPFSGLACGSNLTGHVRSTFSIPRGMLSASITGVIFFSVMAFTLAGCMRSLWELPFGAREVVLRICVREWLVLLAMSCTCLGSAVIHLQAAGNTLRSMAMDGLLPLINARRFPSLRHGASFFWRNWHNFAAYLCMQSFVFLGSPSSVAPLLSLVFLFFTSIMNASVLLLLYIGAPNFRPRFRFWNRSTLLLGVITPLVAMFGINAEFTFIFAGAFLAILVLFVLFAPPSDFGEVSNALSFSQVRKYLLRLGKTANAGPSLKFWRPQPMLLETQSPAFLDDAALNVARVADSMKKGGLFVIASVIQGRYSAEALEAREVELAAWNALIGREGLKALPVCTVASNLHEGVRQCLQLTGLGPVRPNLLLLNWFGSFLECSLNEFVTMVSDAQLMDRHLAICRNFNRIDPGEIIFYADWMRNGATAGSGGGGGSSGSSSSARGIVSLPPPPPSADEDGDKPETKMLLDVWALPLYLPVHENDDGTKLRREGDASVEMDDPVAATTATAAAAAASTKTSGVSSHRKEWVYFAESMELCILLASTLHMNGFWGKHTRLRINVIADRDADKEYIRRAWEDYLKTVRISARINVISVRRHLETAEVEPVAVEFEPSDSDAVPSCVAAARGFYCHLPAKQRLEIAAELLLLESCSTCIAFLPLSPLPATMGASLQHIQELGKLTDRAPPCMLLHSKTKVIYTDL